MSHPQLVLGFNAIPAYRSEDFLVSEANQEAMQWVLAWPDWRAHGLVLYGPTGSGKTHLAHLWAERAGARFVFVEEALALLQQGGALPPLVIELEAEIAEPRLLFHVLNLLREQGGWVLFTAPCAPARLRILLADLRSRLLAFPAVALQQPDDALLEAVLAKHFADRQLRVSAEVLRYIVPRMERSFAAAAAMAERVDKAALQNQRRVTIPLVRGLLAPHSSD